MEIHFLAVTTFIKINIFHKDFLNVFNVMVMKLIWEFALHACFIVIKTMYAKKLIMNKLWIKNCY